MSAELRIEVRFFASVREQLGCAQESVTVPATINTVGQLRDWLMARGGVWAKALAHDKPLRMAYQQVMCTADEPLDRKASQHELAFFPPVTGG